jgi:chromosome segregation protein
MEYILNNTILALLDSPGNTMLGIVRMYVDKKYRKRIVDNIKDPMVKAFWVDEFANYNEKYRTEAIAPIQNKVGQFLSSGIIRNIVGQPKSTIDLREIMDELDGHIKTKFNEAFHNVNAKFEHYFRLLFNGGRAFLSVVKEQEKEELASPESDDETAGQGETLRPEEKMVQKYEQGSMSISGVDIKATPPGKKLSSIQALSGGERALTSIALLCSLLACFPSPFVVLDEVDAALDESNTIRFGQILASLAHQTQFITITHNRETMANSNILYGVTMGDDGISKLLSIKLEAAKAFAK